MSRSLPASVIASLVVLAACGGSESSDITPDDSVGAAEPTVIESGSTDDELDVSSDGSPQDQVAEKFMAVTADAGGLTLLPDCVNNKAKGFSDEDAIALVEAGPNDDPEVSADAEALGVEIATECVDLADATRQAAENLKELNPDLDVDCVVEAVGEVSSYAEIGAATVEAIEGCRDA